MIKIKRSECPDVLADLPSTGNRYRNENVVRALWEMQKKKCCYCEQYIPEEGHGKAVDHFRAQSIFQYLKNEWTNLLLACPHCNGKKSNKFPVMLTNEAGATKVVYLKTASPGKMAIIDPSDPDPGIDPENDIDFIVDESKVTEFGFIIEKDGSVLGRETIKAVGLDRSYYTFKRRDMFLSKLMPWHVNLLDAHINENAEMLEACKLKFRGLMSAKGEFAAFARAFVRFKGLNKPPIGLTIPVGEEE